MVIWITGLTASGKTTIGCRLEHDLKLIGYKNILRLDGEEFRKRRESFKKTHSIKDRWFNIKLIVEIILDEIINHEIIIVSTVSHIRKMRLFARKKIGNFHEIYLSCKPEICAKRDYKNLYKRAKSKNLDLDEIFPGVTEPYQKTKNPELILYTDQESVDESVKRLLIYFKNNIDKKLV